jgi:hypothetical protein
MKKILSMRVSGSITVEATLIFPIILSVLTVILYMQFYYHNQVVLLAGAYRTVSAVSYEKEEKRNGKAGEYDLSKGLMSMNQVKRNIQEDMGTMTMSYEGDFMVPGHSIISFFVPKHWHSIKGEVKVYRRKDIYSILQYKKILKVIQKKDLEKEDERNGNRV